MSAVCAYFQLHQPWRLRAFHFLDIGGGGAYFDADRNNAVLARVSDRCYLPATDLLLRLIERHGGDFRLTFSLTGSLVEQLTLVRPGVLDNFRRLVDTGCVELLAETSHHTLASVFSPREFAGQIAAHGELMERVFAVRPRVFRNTELVFSDDIARQVREAGFSGMLLEGDERFLKWRSPEYVYASHTIPGMRYLLRNYRLSDDVAFRFSERHWGEYPLTADKYARFLAEEGGEVVNLFMDFETFGEHQQVDTGIFEFLQAWPLSVLATPGLVFRTVSEVFEENLVRGEIIGDTTVSWADTERDLSAWLGNSLQKEAAEAVYELEDRVYELGHEGALEVFRRLQGSHLFYYMSTKGENDGIVHSYFNPYEGPHEAYIYYMNILQDFRQKLGGSDRVAFASLVAEASEKAKSAAVPAEENKEESTSK